MDGRKVLHVFGVHYWTPWCIAVATYEAGPLLRALAKNAPTVWREGVQRRRCHLCNKTEIRRLT